MINDNLKSSNLGSRNGGKQKYITRKFLWLVLVLLPGQATDSSTWKHSISGCRYGEVKHAGWENCSWAWTCFPRKNRLYSTVFRTSDFEAQEYSTMCIYVHVFGLKTYWERLGGWQPGPGSHCHNRGVAPSFDANGQKTSCALAMKNEEWRMNMNMNMNNE